jgi:BlaI family transcriptional regulator, penicillinase repressor
MPKISAELTGAEWTIIKAIWEKEPCTAPDVQEQLKKQTRWTYSTVRTLMDRMVAKGLLAANRTGHVTIYRSAVTRKQAQLGELRYALSHAFSGALTPMLQCLLESGNLSSQDLDELESLIKAKRKGTGKSS